MGKYIKKFNSENRVCPICENDFLATTKRQKFCSKDCYIKDYKLKYQKNKKGLGSSFSFLHLRFEIFKRDNFKCQY
jgi:hypothetical protein